MTMVKLETPRRYSSAGCKLNDGWWKQSPPFVQNDRAQLIHRPKMITEHTSLGKRHIAVRYMCDGTATGLKKFTFLDAPPEDRLVCAVCEARAVMIGLPSSSEIAGKHVHLGRMKPVMTCSHGTGEDR